ncbi:MAG TPA: hypothetical protein VE476_11355, partial [Propionibacteriaceae bacterium]|nr:hypothetical protein [Propionibacteriaceae bacterium]
VSHALDEMLSDAEALTRTLLGGEGGAFPEPDDDLPEAYADSVGPRPGLAPGSSGWSISFD